MVSCRECWRRGSSSREANVPTYDLLLGVVGVVLFGLLLMPRRKTSTRH